MEFGPRDKISSFGRRLKTVLNICIKESLELLIITDPPLEVYLQRSN